MGMALVLVEEWKGEWLGAEMGGGTPPRLKMTLDAVPCSLQETHLETLLCLFKTMTMTASATPLSMTCPVPFTP